jgi:alkanesulfonate monooxygenase SsuD/methylene tetrahydromethanopterin reductase-like flavin-dependent oxidoreductase (luciferase family)
MGVKGSERVPRLEESIQLIRRLWDGPTSADGDFWSFPEVDLQPKPVQNPCPIWIASNPNPSKLPPHRFAAAIDRVGRLADGWQSTMITPEEFGQRWDEVRERAEFHGRDSRAMSSAVHLMINLDDDVAAARAEAKRFLDVYYSIDATDEVLDRWGAYGPTETVLKRLGQYTDRGLDVPILRFASFRQSEQMERATTELLPELAKQQTQVTQ